MKIVQKLRFSKKQLIIAGAIIATVILVVCLRGWVRNSVVPAYVEATTGKQVKNISQKTLLPVQAQLAQFDFHFTQSLGYKPGKLCGLAYFHNFKETVHCGIYYSANVVLPTAELKSNWAAHSNDVEAWLSTQGWNKESKYATQSFSALMNTENTNITYKKQEGATICRISLSWQGYESHASKPSLNASTWCQQEVKFFGGNDTLMDDPLF